MNVDSSVHTFLSFCKLSTLHCTRDGSKVMITSKSLTNFVAFSFTIVAHVSNFLLGFGVEIKCKIGALMHIWRLHYFTTSKAHKDLLEGIVLVFLKKSFNQLHSLAKKPLPDLLSSPLHSYQPHNLVQTS
jgi:hypothetical protein